MNIALILAGGHGNRTEQDIPKQFMNVYEKPLIIYTLENFEKHPDIDGIAVVCLEGWHEVLKAYAKQYGITKLKWIVSGGRDGQESTQRGVEALREICAPDDVVLVHDAIRPFLTPEVITDAITKCRKKGLRGLFKKASRSMEETKAKFDKAEINVDKITQQLQNHQVVLAKDIASLDRMFELNQAYFKELTMYIIAGKLRVQELREKENDKKKKGEKQDA